MKDTLTSAQKQLIDALKAAFSNDMSPMLDSAVLDEADRQAVLSLISLDERSKKTVSKNVQIMWHQQQLKTILKDIPFMVIKGSATAVYYPEPIRRLLGDIDIIVAPRFFRDAYTAMEYAGFYTKDSVDSNDRHVHFTKDGVLVELHRRYAILRKREQEELLDDWLYEEKPVLGSVSGFSFPMPKDLLNGLVILSHINQHMEDGVGLRHIIDWVMYVNKCLPDAAWPLFNIKTEQLGLTILAKAVARFGQVYFGLYQEYTWCKDIPRDIVEELLLYVLECGNFGYNDPKTIPMARAMSFTKSPIAYFNNLQQRGMANWKAIKKHKWLKMFAWLYQGCRYLTLGIKGDNGSRLWYNLEISHRRNKLFNNLGIARDANRQE